MLCLAFLRPLRDKTETELGNSDIVGNIVKCCRVNFEWITPTSSADNCSVYHMGREISQDWDDKWFSQQWVSKLVPVAYCIECTINEYCLSCSNKKRPDTATKLEDLLRIRW